MNTGVIDRFTDVFSRYIDSGFGLLGGEVAFLASTLIVIDVTLAGLFWAFGAEDDVLVRVIKKTLYVGFFAFLIGNFNGLAKVVFNSFAGLGLKAAGSGLAADQLLQPGRIAQVGIDAGKPVLQAASQLVGFTSFFENFIQIAVLMIAWLVVLVSFFILAIQLFVTLIEFKLTTLAGFVLIPFGLFNKTSFLAERVLGNVVASGVKVLTLAIIIGIGTTLFGEFTRGFGDEQPTLEDAMALVLASLSLLGLGIFGPGIANGLISGGPQLGAGAAVGAALAAGGIGVAGALGARAGMGALAGAMRGAASVSSGAVSTYRTSAAASGMTGARAAAAGAAGVAGVGASAVADRFGAMVGSSSAGGVLDQFDRRSRGRAGMGRAITPSSDRRAWRVRCRPLGRLRGSWRQRRLDLAIGGPSMKLFRRPSVRYGRTPEPETPYQKADQVWDERIGSARIQARNWRLFAFGNLVLAGGLALGLIWQHTRGAVTPWVVEIDRQGRAQAVAPALADYHPTDPQIAWHLAHFIENVRSIPADPVIVRQNWLAAYEYVTDKGALALSDYARVNDPFAQIGKTQVAIEISSVIRASPDSFRVAWIERRYENGSLAATERWTAILTVVISPARDAERLRKNPLGVFVHALNWSKELG